MYQLGKTQSIKIPDMKKFGQVTLLYTNRTSFLVQGTKRLLIIPYIQISSHDIPHWCVLGNNIIDVLQ